MECLDVAARGGRAWWVAPSYKMSEVGWRPLRRLASRVPGAQIRKVDKQVILPSHGEVSVRSADNPDSLRGEGLDFVVLDECAFMQEAAWSEALRPALADRQGKALFISTPKGRNWFWRLWVMGQSGEEDWQSWQFTSYDNPFINPAEIDAARRLQPDRVFRQEFMAEFIDDAGGVFRGVVAAATAHEQDGKQPGHDYAIGVDWGKHNDFTVLSVIDLTTSELCHVDRFNQIDYAVQTGRLKALASRFEPVTIIAESNAMGEPIIEQLQRDGLPVQAFKTTNATKTAIVDALAMAFEQSAIKIIPDPVMIGELQAYEMERLPSGMLRYSAPEGLHDDCVMALALAWSGVNSTPWLLW